MTRRRQFIGMPIFWIGSAAMAIAAATARGDSITLKNGEVVQGIVRQVEAGYEVTITNNNGMSRRFIASADVKSLKLTNEGKVTEAEALERLSSLRRSVESERNLDRIIGRFQQFVQMNGDTEAAKRAQDELKTWESRREQSMVKVGKRWLTPAQRDQDLIDVARQVETIRSFIEAGQPGEAGVLLNRGLDAHPENGAFLYLNGVMQLERGSDIEARRSFELVTQQIDAHAPTLINIALLNVQFKRWPQAITALEQAMASAPANQEVLDNVLEFAEIAPDTARRMGTFDRMLGTFAKQEPTLAREMATRNLYRWGSKWVDQATLDQAKKDLEMYQKKKVEMQADFDTTNARLKTIQEQITSVQNLIRAIENDSVYFDPVSGRAVRQAYPARYWDAQRDLERLETSQRTEEAHVVELRKSAADLEANKPKPPFEGKLKAVGVRGVPVVLPVGVTLATTTPAESPDATPPTTQPRTYDWRVPMTLPD